MRPRPVRRRGADDAHGVADSSARAPLPGTSGTFPGCTPCTSTSTRSNTSFTQSITPFVERKFCLSCGASPASGPWRMVVDRDVGPTEAVDRLLRIADHGQRAPARPESEQVGAAVVALQEERDLGLHGIGVLELVDEDDLEAVAEVVASRLVVAKQVARPVEQVVELGDPGLATARSCSTTNRPRGGSTPTIASVRMAGWISSIASRRSQKSSFVRLQSWPSSQFSARLPSSAPSVLPRGCRRSSHSRSAAASRRPSSNAMIAPICGAAFSSPAASGNRRRSWSVTRRQSATKPSTSAALAPSAGRAGSARGSDRPPGRSRGCRRARARGRRRRIATAGEPSVNSAVSQACTRLEVEARASSSSTANAGRARLRPAARAAGSRRKHGSSRCARGRALRARVHAAPRDRVAALSSASSSSSRTRAASSAAAASVNVMTAMSSTPPGPGGRVHDAEHELVVLPVPAPASMQRLRSSLSRIPVALRLVDRDGGHSTPRISANVTRRSSLAFRSADRFAA